MAEKTIVIVGAGPGLGLSIAHRFGREDFRVALLARNTDKLAHLTADLKQRGITAEGFVGDVTDEASIIQAFEEIRQRFGRVDVLEYSPITIPSDPADFASLNVTTMTSAVAQNAFSVMALGAVASVGQVLPGMLKQKEGTILITTGASAKGFAPMVGAWGMAGAAVRNFTRTLDVAVRDTNIFVSLVCLGVQVKQGDPFGDPDRLAETYFTLYRERNQSEVFINHLPPGMIELDEAR